MIALEENMNKSILSAVIAIGYISPAFAVDGTITINGGVNNTSCNVVVDGQGTDANIKLETVSENLLINTGDIAGARPFTLDMVACPQVEGVRAKFEQDNVSPTEGNLVNLIPVEVGGAAKVQVQITNALGNAIDLTANGDANLYVPIENGNASVTYQAQYFAYDGQVSAGHVYTALVYTIDYR
ncbi:Fimbrial protein precursor [Pseudomonas marincola]|uniref:Fimbrial-type adhesion domain-containing protein n=2 Tax=Pseudomonas marincola TaxID=437900 RepID=A0A653EA26_9PSED|nr:Fimbrial protein precursor [Pseudomonas marincola]